MRLRRATTGHSAGARAAPCRPFTDCRRTLMTIATLTAFPGTVPTPQSGRLRRFVRRIVRARMITVQRRLLAQLSDQMLKDIGLTRSDIDYVAQALADGYDEPTRLRSLRAH